MPVACEAHRPIGVMSLNHCMWYWISTVQEVCLNVFMCVQGSSKLLTTCPDWRNLMLLLLNSQETLLTHFVRQFSAPSSLAQPVVFVASFMRPKRLVEHAHMSIIGMAVDATDVYEGVG